MSESGTAARPDKRRWSLEGRLRLRLLVVLSTLWVCGSVAALFGLRHEATEVLDSAMAETAQRLLVLPEAALGNAEGEELAAEIGEHEELVIYQLYDQQGRLRLRSHTAPDTPIDPSLSDGIRDVGEWRVLTLTRDDDRRRALVGELIIHRNEVLWASSGWLFATLLAMLPIVALTLNLVVQRAFASMERTRVALDHRPAHELGPLPSEDAPDELQPWLDTVNSLLARVRNLVDAERAFAAHTAHELRTPIAAARAQAQRLVQETAEPRVAERARSLVRQLDRLTTLATRLLQLARIESGVALQREPVDLVLLARIVADEFTEARSNGTLQIDADVAQPCVVAADIDALGIALRNLIDNALKHGRPADCADADAATAVQQVRIELKPSQLAVTDNGPGVPAATLPLLTRPFERGNARQDGTGLGLAMVATIVRQSGAELRLISPVQDGRGLRVELNFPAATPPGDQ